MSNTHYGWLKDSDGTWINLEKGVKMLNGQMVNIQENSDSPMTDKEYEALHNQHVIAVKHATDWINLLSSAAEQSIYYHSTAPALTPTMLENFMGKTQPPWAEKSVEAKYRWPRWMGWKAIDPNEIPRAGDSLVQLNIAPAQLPKDGDFKWPATLRRLRESPIENYGNEFPLRYAIYRKIGIGPEGTKFTGSPIFSLPVPLP